MLGDCLSSDEAAIYGMVKRKVVWPDNFLTHPIESLSRYFLVETGIPRDNSSR